MPKIRTHQQIFNLVATHLLTHKKKSQKRETTASGRQMVCLYRGPNGTKCAVGALIADKDYDPSFEGMALTGYFAVNDNQKKIMKAAGITEDTRMLAADLQVIHDMSKPSQWPARLRQLAAEYKLRLPPILSRPQGA